MLVGGVNNVLFSLPPSVSFVSDRDPVCDLLTTVVIGLLAELEDIPLVALPYAVVPCCVTEMPMYGEVNPWLCPLWK